MPTRARGARVTSSGASRGGPDQFIGLADAMLAWFAGHPGFQAARAVIVELLGAAMAPLGPGVRVPDELLEVRNMLATRVEEWTQRLLREGEQRGEERGAQRGEAALLLRLLEKRFGVLPGWARDRVVAAETVMIEEWGLRLLEAASLEDVLA
jgi:hypothetical protein